MVGAGDNKKGAMNWPVLCLGPLPSDIQRAGLSSPGHLTTWEGAHRSPFLSPQHWEQASSSVPPVSADLSCHFQKLDGMEFPSFTFFFKSQESVEMTGWEAGAEKC